MQNKLYHPLLQRNDSSIAPKHDDMRHLVFLSFVCFALFLPINMVVADEVPSFNVAPSCRAGVSIGTTETPFTTCMQKEKEAHDQLKAQWAQFPKDDKAQCIRMCNCGGLAASYVELLTCLQMASDARKLPKDIGLAPNPSVEKNRNKR